MRRLMVTAGVLALAAIAPAVSHGDDQKIAETIIKRLQVERTEGRLAGFNVKLEVDEGTVWMKGHVSAKQQQDLVLDVARRVPGVRQVVNDIRVTQKTEVAKPAEEPVSIPEPKLAEGPGAIGSGVDVAPLPLPKSKVKSIPEPELATDAQPESAIPVVADNEKVAKTQSTSELSRKPSDQWIGRTLVGKLGEMERQGALHGCHFDLHVEDSTVILEGTTSTERQRTAVLEVARRIYGVRQVVNGVKVGAPIQRTAAAQPVPVSATPVAMGQRPVMPVSAAQAQYGGTPVPMHNASMGGMGVSYDHPSLPNYAWASGAAHPNYAALQYPRQYSPTAWPYIGPFYPYPQVPLGWRKVTLEWDDGWWFLDFNSKK